MQQFPTRDIVQYDSCHTATRMKQERSEQSHYAGYAQELREKFQSGLLSELLPFPHFVV